jgi:hypothetical protein
VNPPLGSGSDQKKRAARDDFAVPHCNANNDPDNSDCRKY